MKKLEGKVAGLSSITTLKSLVIGRKKVMATAGAPYIYIYEYI